MIEIKVLCEQIQELTDDLRDFWIMFNVIWCREFCGWLLGGVRTPIALHCGSFIFNMAVKAAEFGRFWLNIP